MNFRELLEKLLDGEDIGYDGARSLFAGMLSGELDDAQIAAVLAAMRASETSGAELAGAMATMRDRCIRVKLPAGEPVVDTCGTGGDGAKTFNVSTLAALAAAGSGVKVAKHGNRSVSSECGSADVLEAAGLKIDAPVEVVERCITEAGFGFLFAPLYHPALKRVMPVRKSLGVRTIFNVLGPLCNPGMIKRQVLGVADPQARRIVAEALQQNGFERAFVFTGASGLDEIDIYGPTNVIELVAGRLSEYVFDPRDVIRTVGRRTDIFVSSAAEATAVFLAVLDNRGTAAQTGMVALNAAFALLAAGAVADLAQGVELAQTSIASGAARAVFRRAVEISRSE